MFLNLVILWDSSPYLPKIMDVLTVLRRFRVICNHFNKIKQKKIVIPFVLNKPTFMSVLRLNTWENVTKIIKNTKNILELLWTK